MSVARRYVTVVDAGNIAAGFTRVPLDVSGFADYVLQQVQTSAGGIGVAKVYGSALPFGDDRLSDLDPTTNPHWEEDTTLVWAAPGAIGARSVGPGMATAPTANSWATILAEIEATLELTDIAVYFFGKER